MDSFALYFFIYSKLVTILYYLLMDITSLISKLRFELYYKKEDIMNVKIKNADNLTKMKQIKSVIMSKNQTLTNDGLKISGLVLSEDFYPIDDNQIASLRDSLFQTKSELQYEKSLDNSNVPSESNDAIDRLGKTPSHFPILLSNEGKNYNNQNIQVSDFCLFSEKEEKRTQEIRIEGLLQNDPPSFGDDLPEFKTARPPIFNKNLDSIKYSKYVNHNTFSLASNEDGRYSIKMKRLEKEKTLNEVFSENFTEINELLQSLLLCQSTKTKIDVKNNKFTSEYGNEETNTLLNFCEKLGYSFKGSFKITEKQIPVYEIFSYSKTQYFPIIAINEHTKNRARYSIIIGKPFDKKLEIKQDREATLYVRADSDQIIQNLNLSNHAKEKLREKIENAREGGNITIIFAKRKLTAEETKCYTKRKKIIKTSLTIKEEELEELYHSIEENLELICVVCLKENLTKYSMETIKAFHEAQMKIFYVSGDNEPKTLASAFNSGILLKNTEIFRLEVSNQNEALISLKWIIQKLQKKVLLRKGDSEFELPKVGFEIQKAGFEEFSPKKMKSNFWQLDKTNEEKSRFCILINGSSFRTIYANRYSRDHFLFLMIFCPCVCFEFSATDKKRMAKLIKKLDHSSNNYVLGIGNGYNDVLMMKNCDLSIEIKNPNNETICFMGDIVVDDFKKIFELILYRSNEVFIKNEEILFFLFYIILVYLINVFYFSCFSDFTGNILVTIRNFDILILIMSFQIIFIYFTFEKKKSTSLTVYFPLLFKVDMRIKKVEFKRIYLRTIIPALFDSTIIFFFCYFSESFFEGGLQSLTEQNLLTNISFYFIFSIRVNNNLKNII